MPRGGRELCVLGDQGLEFPLALAEVVHKGLHVLDDNIVPQDHHAGLILGEILGQQKCRARATVAFLNLITEPRAPFLAGTEQTEEIADMLAAGHDQDILDPRAEKGLQRIIDHRFLVDR